MAEVSVTGRNLETKATVRGLDALIVGGGLGGLQAARLLAAAGLSFVLLEARSRLGGRILSMPAATAGSPGLFDLGPAWFWPDLQPRMARLVAGLGLHAFPQHEAGLTRIERSAAAPPQSVAGHRQEPASFRLQGGMAALADAVAAQVPPERMLMGHRVTRVARSADGVLVKARTGQGGTVAFEAAAVILAVPPRLAAFTMEFVPPWPDRTATGLLGTSTWMAGQAKFVAIYDQPFWRAAGLSGAARSLAGPLAEVHDASAVDGPAALFGFVGVPVRERAALGANLATQAIAQLGRLFGAEAEAPRTLLFKDWAADDLTATRLDLRHGSGYPGPGTARAATWGPGVLAWAGSEAASGHGGYLEGALEAAEAAVSALVSSPGRLPVNRGLAL